MVADAAWSVEDGGYCDQRDGKCGAVLDGVPPLHGTVSVQIKVGLDLVQKGIAVGIEIAEVGGSVPVRIRRLSVWA